jgi:hypothetical protein
MWCAFVAAFVMMSLLLWCNMTPSLAKVSELERHCCCKRATVGQK